MVTADLQNAVMRTRMQPVKKVFGRFPRLVRDLARNLKKEVILTLQGEETDLDKNLVEALADPLVHLVRNSIDHGIETPAIRAKAGKPREGRVVLAAQQEGDHILLSIRDDGAGMDPEVLRRKAIEKGLLDEETAERLNEKGCFDLIFMPGLSTRAEISDVSGRGVGMDVVKTTITQLNGTIEIDSKLGEGTILSIRVPLTLAILPTLMVRLGRRKFALPLGIVNEIFELSSKNIRVVDGREVVMNRGKAPPIFHLRKWLLRGADAEQEFDGDPHVIMVQVGNDSIGLVADQVIGQEEVVIKPLGKMLRGLPGLAGSTITGDGHIAIILDVPSLLQAYA
jgi:two-component system chemotaxis sensor kinase CheA